VGWQNPNHPAGVSGRKRIGFSKDALNFGAVKVLERKAKLDSCRSPGSPHSPQGTGSPDRETGRINSKSRPHREQ